MGTLDILPSLQNLQALDHFSSQGLRVKWDMKVPSQRHSPHDKPGLISIKTPRTRREAPSPGSLRLHPTSASVFSYVRRGKRCQPCMITGPGTRWTLSVLVPHPPLWAERGHSTHCEAPAGMDPGRVQAPLPHPLSQMALDPAHTEALSPCSYPKAETQSIKGKWRGHRKRKPGPYRGTRPRLGTLRDLLTC